MTYSLWRCVIVGIFSSRKHAPKLFRWFFSFSFSVLYPIVLPVLRYNVLLIILYSFYLPLSFLFRSHCFCCEGKFIPFLVAYVLLLLLSLSHTFAEDFVYERARVKRAWFFCFGLLFSRFI